MKFHFLYLLIFLTILPFKGISQQYNFRNYNVEDGLAQSQVYASYQDQTGNLWLGTRGGGISLFDGFEFHSITDQQGLPSNYINKIVGDGKGKIWIGTNKGICYYDGISFTTIDFRDLKSASVRDIHLTKYGVYFASNKGVFKVENGEANPIGKSVGVHKMDVTSLWVDDASTIWIGSDKGFFCYKKNRLIPYSEQSKYMRNAVTTIKKDDKGNYWIGTYGDGMYCYNGSKFFRIDYHHELYRQTVLDIHTEDDENLWIATLRGGVIHYDKTTKIFTSIRENEGLSNNHVRCIIQDNSDNFWFGTSGGGICHYLGKQFTNFDEQSGLAGNFIYSVLRDSKGRLWVGNSQKGVSVSADEGFINYHGGNEFQNVKVKAIAEDNQGSIWLGTDGRGVYVYKEERFIAIDELRQAYVKQITKDKAGNIWIATAGMGLIKISIKKDNYVIDQWNYSDGLLSSRLTSLHLDKKGRIWYGTEGDGVGCFDEKKKTYIKLTNKNWLSSNQIRSLTEDQYGRLWIGTAGDGICGYSLYSKMKEKRFIGQYHGLKSNNVYLLTTDQDGNVIVGTEKGLDYIFLNDKGATRQIKHYGKLDGFTGVETCQNSVWNDENGAIWFGTINGLCRFNPSELVKNSQSPILSFKDIKLNYESILAREKDLLYYGKQLKKSLYLPYYDNHITFEFLGVNLKRPEGVMYKWKLVGFDDQWSPPSKDRSILYSNLNPGKYRFMLMASNEDGVWSEKPLIFIFEIETPYWQTNWFIGLMIFAGFVLLLLIYFILIRRIRKKARAKQREFEIEKEFMELEQKAMRLQMNPHFIFNALNSIQSLIGTGKETEARYYLAKFSRLMRQILDNSRQSEITLMEEINSLENYLLIEQFCNGGRFDYAVEVNEEMETDFINIPPMLIQPFVENAIKHGMKGRTDEDEKGMIRLTFNEKEGVLECTIEDNGIGRRRAEELKKISMETYHTSTGLSVTSDRLQMVDNSEGAEPLEIIDLYENDKAVGTKVIIRIPIE